MSLPEVVLKITHALEGQFAASSLTETAPSTPEELERYIASGNREKGIGERTAKRIVGEFGAKVLEIIAREPERVAKIPGVGAHNATLLAQRFSSQDQTREGTAVST